MTVNNLKNEKKKMFKIFLSHQTNQMTVNSMQSNKKFAKHV